MSLSGINSKMRSGLHLLIILAIVFCPLVIRVPFSLIVWGATLWWHVSIPWKEMTPSPQEDKLGRAILDPFARFLLIVLFAASLACIFIGLWLCFDPSYV